MESKPDDPAPGDEESGDAWRQIEAALTLLERDATLLREGNFLGRAEALDRIEAGILDRLDGLSAGSAALVDASAPRWHADGLRHRAVSLVARLEAADAALFRRLRADIRRTGCTGPGFRALLEPLLGSELHAGRGAGRPGYDLLDAFFNGLLHSRPVPDESRPREAGMVFFQKTPARVILELAEAAHPTVADIFCDVGSGLGQVTMLMHLLTGTAARGIEVDPAYCGYAKDCAEDLGLRRVEFLRVDARDADYSAGTVFFLYTPCEGRMLEEVLERMRIQARPGSRIFMFGPCAEVAARCRWLHHVGQPGEGKGGLAAFISARQDR